MNNRDSSRLKYNACAMCRSRKSKCDRIQPRCSLCSRLGKDCTYSAMRKKSGPKRNVLEELEIRLTKVEGLLEENSTSHRLPTASSHFPKDQPNMPMSESFRMPSSESTRVEYSMFGPMQPHTNGKEASQVSHTPFPLIPGNSSNFQSSSIGLAFREQLPSEDIIYDLDNIFFEKVYPSIPIIHPNRFLINSSLSAHLRLPLSLRYMIWCHASLFCDRYYSFHSEFYQRARQYAEVDETTESFGRGIVTLSHCQAWILMSIYELRMVLIPRAWVSIGKACSLSLIIGLNQLDGPSQSVKLCMPPPKDWVEGEERRRVFWMAFCIDQYASIATGRPMLINETDVCAPLLDYHDLSMALTDRTQVMTTLPAFEQSFLENKPQLTLQLYEILTSEDLSSLSSLAYVCVSASLLGRSLSHIRRIQTYGNYCGLDEQYSKQHQSYYDVPIRILQRLPMHLRLSSSMHDTNVIFANLCVHASTIWYHQQAIFSSKTCRVLDWYMMENHHRCLLAASQISSLTRMIGNFDLLKCNTFVPFPLFLAARVFVLHLDSQPNDPTIRSLLQYLVSILKIMKSSNPSAGMFLSRLNVSNVPASG
ncbi:uncharacterized protein N7503_000393 [Penicillium pulvis]|uniref:uncharacterized protein n=1 Tax=Penicillium pulvis TaxID=1562058 RepID=UPI0025466D4A|nr:uncharacterized protein N7503_000393 [Penicillium pulvis]KAJ5813643.1 hypothetical protein N7503_000393 [Penicillium pulvis]